MPKRFHLQEHHLKLARRMYVDWHGCETGAPEINPKRPYGNSSVAVDVAEIIGEHWPDESELSPDAYEREAAEMEPRMLAVHAEMQTALQIMLGRAGEPVPLGWYVDVARAYCRPSWVPEASA